jgi:hypothetical protein
MIESLVLEKPIAGHPRETSMDFLLARFGPKAESLGTELKAVDDEARLKELVRQAATSRTLVSFRKKPTS